MKKVIRPLHERVILREDVPAEKTSGGIFIPEEAKEVPTEGTIISIGNKVNDEGENLKPGDRVMYMKYAGLPIKIGGESLRMIMCNDILAVIEEAPEETTE
jgi:chaperonin GroES